MSAKLLSDRVRLDPAVPEPVRRAFETLGSPDDPRVNLFRDVIARAVLDAIGETGLVAAGRVRHETVVSGARAWLKFGVSRNHFFELADLEVEDVVPHVLAVRPRGW